jgi:muconolactone D-isomerase
MLYFFDVRVLHEDMSFDELWESWEREANAALPAVHAGKLRAYKVAGQRRVVGVIEAESHDELDKLFMADLPMAHVLEFVEIVPVREYEAFAEDVKRRWK